MWPEGTQLVRITGHALPGPQAVPISQAGPSSEVAISVQLQTPRTPGTYESYWRLQAPGGQRFGAVLFLRVIVAEGAPALPLRVEPLPTTVVPPNEIPTPTTAPALAQAPTPTALPTSEPTAVPTLAPTAIPTSAPTATPVVVPTDTPMPTETPTATATPTSTPPPDSASTCGTVDDRFNSVVNQATALGIQVLCATGPVQTVSGQVQEFRQNVEQADPNLRFRSLMVLRDDTSRVYVLDGKDVNTYEASVMTYAYAGGIPDDEVPSTCSGLAVPEGYRLPTGRIGATWCNHSLWISAAGWPRNPAANAVLDIQETTNGLLIRAISQTQPTYLIAIDFGARRATVD